MAITRKDTRASMSQLERFKTAARELGADQPEEAFDAALRKIASAPPAPQEKKPAKPDKSKAD